MEHPTTNTVDRGDDPAVYCSNQNGGKGICTKECASSCNTGKIMPPEEMVAFGWSIESARHNQRGFTNQIEE